MMVAPARRAGAETSGRASGSAGGALMLRAGVQSGIEQL